jgi:hypothetical protein
MKPRQEVIAHPDRIVSEFLGRLYRSYVLIRAEPPSIQIESEFQPDKPFPDRLIKLRKSISWLSILDVLLSLWQTFLP